ncbi:dolichyl-phosphate beta-glucosyltransferase [Spizellomyces punctatus DAOM BR117]|uniref:dolichyl-phosphate beta-glucosyltransferase n=1 Tax=Spizellomyces punctatus (strain DAOM BR117) TaxID=645134 RepID=A0A0L0HKF3_SPIPD|nr:dolichyl-phosphate beta-glucosyltransferase [Spizellomyces punctatus DAOM BR117]KND01375.1 hypothetical protein SPPG_03187 [Spizellomyces punctatus DAOM BR117]|eukprot:XP_016609414.1 hypothetical protein SPPG_03187 [Spizellomyces punctatus DAOM BR117]
MGIVSTLTVPAELSVLAVVLLGILVVALYIVSPRPRPATENEVYYLDAGTGTRTRFPSLLSEPQYVNGKRISLSVIVPAYKETARLPSMLKETVEYLDNRTQREKDFLYEIIIVDDGSGDDTSRKLAVGGYRVMTLKRPRKGGAVTQGMLVSRGQKLLFADADGATRFSDVEELEARLDAVSRNGLGVAVGSRAHMVKSDAVVKRSFIRNFLMHGFHTVLFILGIASIKDTQCGFKLLTRGAARSIFPNMHAEGWIFDIELLLIALNLGIPIVEVPVNWHEVEGTKMSLVRDSVVMLVDLLVIRLNYLLGLWQVKGERQKQS